jgi:hypothetical protein
VTLRSSTARPPRRRRRGRQILGILLGIAAAAIVFAVGVALGQALEDRPEPSQPVTEVSTIQPWTQTGQVTVTVTQSAP